MCICNGSARVSAMIDIHEGTEVRCMNTADGEIEVRLGGDADAYLFLTESGAKRLVDEISARVGLLRVAEGAADFVFDVG